MGTPARTFRRRFAIVAAGVAALGANIAAGGETVHRLPYLLAGLTILVLLQAFWEERGSGSWLAVSSGTMIVALLTSITFSVGRAERDEAVQVADATPSTEVAAQATTTILLTGTDVPAEVQGAVESREDAQRLLACETALEQIAAAIRRSGGAVDDPPATPAAGLSDQDLTRRLQNCDVRLRAIAATLPG